MTTYRADIDGLRALAVVPVVLFHAGFDSFSGGFIGVDVFFVISGYLITRLITEELDAGRFSLVRFYERRARRILPAMLVVLLACLPAAWFWLLPADLKAFSQSLLFVLGFASNVLFWRTSGYFDTSAEFKPLLHTWSLAVEEQFYLVFPLVMVCAWRLGRRWTMRLLGAMALASLAWVQWASTAHNAAAFYLLSGRVWELLLGGLLALGTGRGSAGTPSTALFQRTGAWVGLCMLLLAVAGFDKTTPYPGLYTLVPVVGTALILLCSTPHNLVGRLLGSRALVGLGLLSYSAYLWHQPLLAFARHRSVGEPGLPLMGGLAAGAFVAAYFTWKHVEQPCRNAQRVGRRQFLALVVPASLALLALGAMGVAEDGYPARLGPSARHVLATAQDVSHLTNSGQRGVTLGNASRLVGVLIGDSHAESLAQALGEQLALDGIGLHMLTKNGCPPMRGLYRFDMTRYGDACNTHYAAIYQRVLGDPALKVVVVAARLTLYLEGERFDNGEGGRELGQTRQVVYDGLAFRNQARSLADRQQFLARQLQDDLRTLLQGHKRVVLIYPIPEVGWDTPSTGIKRSPHTAEPIGLSTAFARFEQRNALTRSVLDGLGNHPNLVRIYPHERLCNRLLPGRCLAIEDSTAYYRDSNHLSNSGARLLAADIVANISP